MPDRQLASQPDLLDPEAERRILRCSSVNTFLPFNVEDPYPYDPYVLSLPDPDPLVRSTDPDPSIIKQK
jgi:hypothetical protein